MHRLSLFTFAAAALALAACTPAQQMAVSTDIANGQKAVVGFCITDQPIVGTTATIAADTVGAVIPAAAPAGVITGLVVQNVNGVCDKLIAQSKASAVATPPAGTVVAVPTAVPSS